MVSEGNITVPLIIKGKEVTHESTYEIINPATGKPCWTAVSASPDDAIKAVEAAQAAFPAWSSSHPTTRSALLHRVADHLETNAEEYASYMMTEMGADRGAAQYFVLPLAISMCRSIAARCVNICGSVPVVAQKDQSAMVWKEPYGVCLSIVPWCVEPVDFM